MKGICIFCSELFTDTCDISATVCGHTFHRHCLMEWLTRSKTCPHCRRKLNESRNEIYYKLYFDPGDDSTTDDDPAVLKNKISDLDSQNKENAKELAEVKRKLADQVEITNTIQEHLQKVEATNEDLEVKNSSLESQLQFLRSEAIKVPSYERELVVMKAKLEKYNKLEVILHGTPDETEQMLAQYGKGLNLRDIASFCVTLKKDLAAASKCKTELTLQIRRSLRELTEGAKKVTDLTANLSRSEEERKQLEERLNELLQKSETVVILSSSEGASESEDDNDGTKREVINTNLENAAGKKENQKPTQSSNPKPVTAQNVHSAAMGARPKTVPQFATCLAMKNRAEKCAARFSNAKPPQGTGYNGLGGHSKPDIFPTGRRNAFLKELPLKKPRTDLDPWK